ncbi:MAG: DUF2236 domain-containing protein [Bacteroidia bacterium]|nr:DUF2236 domain-containing protein [Bacteroidia bacterium]NND26354.1 DUF2236 domain-containing protein [Flavobacteriaceae bacterium]MBT8278476.1 DUF2236 domain-containing protein [Bacteroidia bacterium]NNK59132.1 DUF2236 domain-containing protein [Flavobacteriaceae bacterium]NNL31706.1 DUF2236 domain-containing protein [Flavobacteriaceae bacterium]
MKNFVESRSIVRKIWGKSDTILFIFAGASAEFALNKAVDWLYFTGKLPSDPLGRLFSTVSYARRIVFASESEAFKAIDTMTQIHTTVEKKRGASIPDWAYRDVLFMLIYYSISAYELLEKPLTLEDKEEVYDVFYRVGMRMGLKDLPLSYKAWIPVRQFHLEQDLQMSAHTSDLFKQYREHLGYLRFKVLLEAQKLVLPYHVRTLLNFNRFSILKPSVFIYKVGRNIKLDRLIKKLLLPSDYKAQIRALDISKP